MGPNSNVWLSEWSPWKSLKIVQLCVTSTWHDQFLLGLWSFSWTVYKFAGRVLLLCVQKIYFFNWFHISLIQCLAFVCYLWQKVIWFGTFTFCQEDTGIQRCFLPREFCHEFCKFWDKPFPTTEEDSNRHVVWFWIVKIMPLLSSFGKNVFHKMWEELCQKNLLDKSTYCQPRVNFSPPAFQRPERETEWTLFEWEEKNCC